MARQYVRMAFLKAAPNSLLQRYFAKRRLGGNIPWKHLPEKMVDDIHRCIEKAPKQKRSEIDRDFQEINDLADEGGVRTIIAEAANRHHGNGKGIDLVPLAAKAEAPLHFACQVFLDYPDVFAVARDLHRADAISQTRWRRRFDLDGCRADTSRGAAEQLGTRLSEYYMLKEGRGQQCHVNHWERDDRLYWFAYRRLRLRGDGLRALPLAALEGAPDAFPLECISRRGMPL
jgi:hypothetical protein